MRLILGFFTLLTLAQSQTTLDLAGPGPSTIQIVSPGCSGTPLVCTVNADPIGLGLNTNDKIVVFGACAVDGLNNISAATGLRKISSLSTTTITLKDYANTPVASNGSWCLGNLSGGASEGIQAIRRLTTYTLPDHPRVMYDGPTGEVTNRLSSEPVSLVVNSSHIATITSSFDLSTQKIPLVSGRTISLWNTNNNILTPANGQEYGPITVTGTNTFTFAVNASIPAATYTSNPTCGAGASPNGTIQGTDNCVRWSQSAIAANPWWAGMLIFVTNSIGGSYKFGFQGSPGTSYSTPSTTHMAKFATLFLVDQKRQDLIDAGWDYMDHIEMLGGNNFSTNENATDGGHYALAEDTNAPWAQDLAQGYSIFRAYGTTARRQAFIDKMISNITDPIPCTPVHYISLAVAGGTGIATAGSSTTITLAVGSSITNGFYVGNAVEAVVSGVHTFGRITAYNGITLQATVASWNNGNPTTGSTYTIWQTVTVSGTTITGINTTWNTAGPGQLHAGDFIVGATNWTGFFDIGALGAYVVSVTNDTTATIRINPSSSMFSATIPVMAWVSPAWTAGNCGYYYVQSHFGGHPGQPVQFGNRGGTSTKNPDGTIILGSNNVYAMYVNLLSLFIAFADDDSRCNFDAASASALSIDTHMAFALSYVTGLTQSGANYGLGTTIPAMHRMAWLFSKNFIGFPSFDTTGPLFYGPGKFLQYGLHPDKPFYALYATHVPFPAYFGGNNTPSMLAQACGNCAAIALDPGIIFNPQAITSQYTADFLKNTLIFDTYQRAGSQYLPEMVAKLPPNTPTSNYKVQPLQQLFKLTSDSIARTNFGYTLPAYRADAFISRSDWSSNTASQFLVRSSTFSGDHDDAQPLKHDFYKVGYLLSNNFLIPGDSENPGSTLTQNAPQFGATSTLRNGYGNSGGASVAEILRWSGSTPYGDSSSYHACGMGSAAGAYTTTLNYLYKWFCHFKEPGTGEVLVFYTSAKAPSPIIMKDQEMFPQNNEITSTNFGVIYNEGDTSCPGSGGCANIDATRLSDGILEQQDGLSTNGDPIRQYNLVGKYWSPTAITLNWAGATSPGNAYKLEIFAGITVGGTATVLEAGQVYCVLTQPTTSCPVSVLSPDSNWTGINTADKAALFAINGVTQSILTPVSVTMTNPGFVFLGNITAGSYHLQVGSFDCGNYTVTNGVNSITCRVGAAISGGNITLTGGSSNRGLFPMPVPIGH